MKSPLLPASAIILASILNFYALFSGLYWLENLTYMLFFILAIFLVFPKRKKFNRNFYFFIGLTCLSYFIRFFSQDWFVREVALIFLALAYVVLMVESSKFIVPKRASTLMGIYFVLVLGVNFLLLSAHILEIKAFIASKISFWIYILYYLNLFVLAVISFLYYLNSYSRKAVYFISLVLGVVFADVLRDMGVFYFQDPSVQMAESIIRLGSAIFAVLFFVTKEKQLRLANLI